MPAGTRKPQGDSERAPRRWRWPAWAAGAVLLIVLGAAGYLHLGQTYWTDDHSIRVRDGQARVRHVLWSPAEPLAGKFNTPEHEYEPCVSADGTELYFVRGTPGEGAEIHVSFRRNNAWTDPVPLADVNTDSDELGARLTPDMRFLIFYSDRPGGLGQYDIWAAERTETGWAKPFNLGPTINTQWSESGGVCDPAGRLYFATNRRSAGRHRHRWRATIRQPRVGNYDVFVAEPLEAPTRPALPTGARPVKRSSPDRKDEVAAPLAFEPARELAGVNTPFHEGTCCISSADHYLYFTSNRPGGLGGFDLYRGRLTDGACGPCENLGPQINTPGNETDPHLTLGGFRMVFSSDRGGQKRGYDLFTTDSREVHARRQIRAVPNLGWKIWVLLGAIALLLPLVLFLKAGGYRHLDLLQKCLFVSLLVHLLAVMTFDVILLSSQIIEYVAREAGMTVAVNLEVSREFEVGQQVRRQVTEPLPMAEAELAHVRSVPQVEVAQVTALPPEINVPKVIRRPATMTIQPEAPPMVRPEAAERISLPPPKVASERPVIDLRAPMHVPVAQVESTPPRAKPARGRVDRLQREPPVIRPSEVKIADRRARPNPKSLARLAEAKLAGLTVVERFAARARGPSPLRPDVVGPQLRVPPVDARQTKTPGVAEPSVAAHRLRPAPFRSIHRSDTKVPDILAEVRRHSLAVPIEPTPRFPVAVEEARPQVGPSADIMVKVTGPAIRAKAAAEKSVAPTVAVPPVRSAAVKTDAARSIRPGPAEAPLRGARAEVSVESLAAAAEPTTRAPPALEERIAAAVPPAVPGPQTAGLRIAAPAVSADSPTGPVVPQARVRPTRQPTASPHGRVALTETALPAAEIIPRSLAASVPHRPPRSSNPVPAALELPVPNEAVQVKLPVLSARRPVARKHPVVAASIEPPRAMEPRPISRFNVPEPASAHKPLETLMPTQANAVSLVHGPVGVRHRPGADDAVADDVKLQAMLVRVAGSPGPRGLGSPQSLFQRSFEQRHKIIDEMGGSKESERAVERALVYLAKTQEPDGRWTFVRARHKRGGQKRHQVDTAVTGLAALCFLAADHTPGKDGPHRQTIRKAIEFLIGQQRPDGDLRGRGRMYGHAIATLAVSEAAIMTGQPTYRQAAIKGARFILKAQHPKTGGWRYNPGDPGDTSVLGWQVMALHSVESLGFKIPHKHRQGAFRWLDRVSRSKHKMLAGYVNSSPTPPMTAEAVFSRMLLGQQLAEPELKEVCDYLMAHPPGRGKHNFYYWYYASLAVMQMQNETWQKWNVKMRDLLIKLQTAGGELDGSWDIRSQYGAQGGRIYTTALATLTLEVYYRYLPMYAAVEQGPRPK